MQLSRFVPRLSFIFLAIALPVGVSAAIASEALKTADDRAVTRGEFIRAIVRIVGTPLHDSPSTSYLRVPEALLPYVDAADAYGALEVFGGRAKDGRARAADLRLARPITRGEALTVAAAIKALSAPDMPNPYTDVPKGSLVENAVKVARRWRWMEPESGTVFGSSKTLTGKEGRLLLRKIQGEAGKTISDDGVPEIRIELPTARHDPALPKEDLFREVWALLIQQYMRQDKIDANEAAYRALEAMVAPLDDPYTAFYRPAVATEFRQQLAGEVTGIGITVEFETDAVIVVSPVPGSPAERAGVKAGDRITAVGDVSLAGVSPLDAIAKIRGPKGTTVKIHVRRGDLDMAFSIVRGVIAIPELSVSWHGTVAVVKIAQFGEITGRDIRSMLSAVQLKKPTGIILDLRNNPGGLLDTATTVVGNFLPMNSVMASIITRNETYQEKTTDEPTIDPGVKVAILVNKGSASASEIVAGALQDTKRATVIGQTTYGKGVVQNVNPLSDGSILKVTIAEWITPNGNHIDHVGVSPDIAITPTDGRDEEMLAALRILK